MIYRYSWLFAIPFLITAFSLIVLFCLKLSYFYHCISSFLYSPILIIHKFILITRYSEKDSDR